MDDWTMLATSVFFIAYLSCQIAGVRYGIGQRVEHLDQHDAQVALEVKRPCSHTYE